MLYNLLSLLVLQGLLNANLIQNGSFEACQPGYEPTTSQWGLVIRGLPAGMGSVDHWNIALADGVFSDNVSVTGSADLLVTLTNPTHRRVFQRDEQNLAQVPVAGSYMGTATRVEARAVVMDGYTGVDTGWQVVSTGPTDGSFSGALMVQAGGWYRIEVQAYNGEVGGPVSVIEKVGVGEVFITAGQSNSANYGQTTLGPTHDTVSAWTGSGNAWRHGYDPQPYADGTKGSAWSRLVDLLANQLGVPIGFISTGVGSTRVDQWVPGSTYYPRLQAAIAAAGSNRFRSFLWHQGESDSLASTSAEDYASRLNSIIAQTRVYAGWPAPWGVALASYHPDSLPPQETQVRQGQLDVIAADTLVHQGQLQKSMTRKDVRCLHDSNRQYLPVSVVWF